MILYRCQAPCGVSRVGLVAHPHVQSEILASFQFDPIDVSSKPIQAPQKKGPLTHNPDPETPTAGGKVPWLFFFCTFPPRTNTTRSDEVNTGPNDGCSGRPPSASNMGAVDGHHGGRGMGEGSWKRSPCLKGLRVVSRVLRVLMSSLMRNPDSFFLGAGGQALMMFLCNGMSTGQCSLDVDAHSESFQNLKL